ncbi:50S ribosomal protein L25 [candidate division KSB1 bacterium]|nr:50S ribosomal protein L25 [candidate division KSB1 bacterium]NIR69914.1 50S ribosomal protein L25 [candidate division KSB1 bacterium]NIS25823.1 50S ribosomal protein L25 [candidate division KSB1 bacterium]NIT72698.1 50S ribosomal protein L25 [candidate division KSB1 bacterium]NIU26512.1 50S ribosomal protein L25 [candidate division KSB1 bacterium]
MSELELNVEKRDNVGKQTSKELRRAGRIPGIYYIHGENSIPFSVDEKQLNNAIYSESSVIDLKFDSGKKTKCVIRDIQWHPLFDRPLHVDLMGIKMTEKIQVEVPVHFVGEAIGVKRDGGVLQQVVREIEVECLPGDIPEHLEVDVSELEIGDTFRVEELANIANVKLLADPDQTLAVVRPPRIEVEPTVELEEEAAEPELVGEEKEAEEEPEETESSKEE